MADPSPSDSHGAAADLELRAVVAATSPGIRASVARILLDAGYRVETIEDWNTHTEALLRDPDVRRLTVIEAGTNVALLVQTVYELYRVHREAGADRPVIVGICSEAVLDANMNLGVWLIDGHAALLCLVVTDAPHDLEPDWRTGLRNLVWRIVPYLRHEWPVAEAQVSVAADTPLELRVTLSDQTPGELLTQTGEWLEQRHLCESALAYYRAAPAADTASSLASYREGRLLAALGRQGEAVEAFRRAIDAAPDHAPTYHLAAKACLATGDLPGAISYATEALRLDPNNVGAILVSLRCLVASEQWDRIGSLLQHRPDALTAWEVKLILALTHCRLGDRQAASEQWLAIPERARRRHPELARLVHACLFAEDP
ncbi:MAG: hypothetical protein FJX72_01405 [Armatimonadetes bacterium]|nr:hypothetical protein [Armatimonadota bacterium]